MGVERSVLQMSFINTNIILMVKAVNAYWKVLFVTGTTEER